MSKYLFIILIFLVSFSLTSKLKAQNTQYKYSYSFSISGNNSSVDQKNNIDFLREHFNTKKCIFNISNFTYTLYLNNLINTNDLKTKLIAIGIPVNNKVQLNHLEVIDNQSQQNNN